jgi:hypothetical protein
MTFEEIKLQLTKLDNMIGNTTYFNYIFNIDFNEDKIFIWLDESKTKIEKKKLKKVNFLDNEELEIRLKKYGIASTLKEGDKGNFTDDLTEEQAQELLKEIEEEEKLAKQIKNENKKPKK